MLLLVNLSVQHGILGSASGMPLRRLLAIPQHFEIRDRQDGSLEGRNEVSHLMPSMEDSGHSHQDSCNWATACRVEWGLGTT
jgi:hypothetical protein